MEFRRVLFRSTPVAAHMIDRSRPDERRGGLDRIEADVPQRSFQGRAGIPDARCDIDGRYARECYDEDDLGDSDAVHGPLRQPQSLSAQTAIVPTGSIAVRNGPGRWSMRQQGDDAQREPQERVFTDLSPLDQKRGKTQTT